MKIEQKFTINLKNLSNNLDYITVYASKTESFLTVKFQTNDNNYNYKIGHPNYLEELLNLLQQEQSPGRWFHKYIKGKFEKITDEELENELSEKEKSKKEEIIRKLQILEEEKLKLLKELKDLALLELQEELLNKNILI